MKYIHIAGTNGKGSVSEYIYSILMAAGKRAACFTSPHLVSPTERLRANGRSVTEEELKALLAEVARRKLAVNDTLFAAYTAAALLWFERQAVEYAVIETGIGGRHDSTNVITPSVCVITPIGYDHMALLGSTLREIAYDKCGIIKAGVPVVSAVQEDAAMRVIEAESRRLGAPLTLQPPVRILKADANGQQFEMAGERWFIRAIGRHQPCNAALAVMAAQTLGIGRDAIDDGLSGAALRCRAQLVTGQPDILLDGAHNMQAAQALCDVLDDYFADRKKTLLFACMKDKAYASIVRLLAPRFSEVFVTSVNLPRSAAPQTLAALFPASVPCHVVPDAPAAFESAKRSAEEAEALLVVCGSFYLAGLVGALISS